jgi:hypothetical protein
MLNYQRQIYSCAVNGTALVNSAALTSLLPAVIPTANLTLPPRFLTFLGQELILEAEGIMSTLVTTPGTLAFTFRLGPTANISVAVTQALALNIVAKTDVLWALRLVMQARNVGGSAKFRTFGRFTSEAVIGSPVPTVGGSGTLLIPASAPVDGTAFDSTVANKTDLMAQWSVGDPANSIQLQRIGLYSGN